MPLNLRVIGEGAGVHGDQSVVEVMEPGGTIGRAAYNEFVLPDAERYLSATHAVLRYRDGAWWITDVSRNGTCLNDPDAPIGREDPAELRSGDRLFVGEYELAVSVCPPRSASPDDVPATNEAITAPSLYPGSAGGCAQESPDKVRREASGGSGMPADSRQAAAPADADVRPFWQDFDPQPEQEPQPEVRQPPSGESAASPTEERTRSPEFRSFLEAAGLEAADLADAPEELMRKAGLLLRTMVIGLLNAQTARNNFKQHFRIPVTIVRTEDNNPLKFSARPDEALARLLAPRERAYMESLESVRESFADIAAHQLGTIEGMRAGYRATLNHFKPDYLNGQWALYTKHTKILGVAGKPRHWELYQKMYQQLIRECDRSFQRLFGEEFGRAYWEELRRLGRDRS